MSKYFDYVDDYSIIPETDLKCYICKDEIKIDEMKNDMPNCVICSNGHRMHRECYNISKNIKKKSGCRCGSDEIFTCGNLQKGYSILKGIKYREKKGGKRKTTKKRKTNKKRKSYRKK